MLSKKLEKIVNGLENRRGKKKLVTVLQDCSQEPVLFEIPTEQRFLNEAEFREWRKKLGSDVKLLIIQIWLNKQTRDVHE